MVIDRADHLSRGTESSLPMNRQSASCVYETVDLKAAGINFVASTTRHPKHH